MTTTNVTVEAENGIHARPASELVKMIKGFAPAKVTLKANGKSANGASIISVLALGIKKGTALEICAEGENEAGIADAVTEFVQNLK